MAPGIYKSYRKAWDKNRNKLQQFVATYGLDLFPGIDYNKKDNIIFKSSKTLTDDDIETYLLEDNKIYDKNHDKTEQMLVVMTNEDVNRECYQAMEAFIHNLNTMHSRGGGQVAFSSVNLGCALSEAGRMVTKNLLLNLEAGLGNGETSIFPITIFLVKEGFNYNPEDKNYDLFKLACRVTGKRLYPNFCFEDSPFNAQYYKEGRPETLVQTMGE